MTDQPSTPAQPLFLTYAQVAERLTVSRKTVQRLVSRGELESVRVLGGMRVLRTSLERFLRSVGANN